MKAVTLRLDPADYRRLEAEAKQLGVLPGTLARVYVRAGLTADTVAQNQRRRGPLALDRLKELTAELPAVDAVQIARQGREELEQRSVR